MRFSREWCLANKDTLSMQPARQLVLSYIKPNMEIVDPFAKDCTIAKWRNDLNPNTKATFHLDALEFLRMIQNKVAADIVIFDPPYSKTQAKREYENIGRQFTMADSQRIWHEERYIINKLLKVGGIVISFGWNSSGMGINRLYEIIEIKLLCHGEPHYDTIIIVEQKLTHQENLFEQNE
jgi:hypothetical protein